MIDVDHQISEVDREVGSRTLPAGDARVVTITQTYDATVDDVWDACTNPERIPRWFAPVSGELREGGRYQIEGNAGGTIDSCDPPRRFTATWEFGGDVSWIEVQVSPAGEGSAELRLQHIAHVDDERWAEFGPGAVGVGWDMALMGLATHLSERSAVDPGDAEAWMASDDGHEFVVASSERWRAANVAAGADATAAREAAERTSAFYTATDADAD